jgi:hypothetical protein
MKKSFLLWQKGFVVGVAGFEPAASCSQSRRDNRATLHPEASAKIRFNFTLQNEMIEINKIYFYINF